MRVGGVLCLRFMEEGKDSDLGVGEEIVRELHVVKSVCE